MTSFVERLKAVTKAGFGRSVGVLVGGTALAQVIMAVSLPIATRLYSPHDFSLLALFTAIIAIISVAACLRFDIAIPIPEEDSEAASLLALASTFAILVAFVLFVLVLVMPSRLAILLRRPDFEPYLWVVPVAVLMASLYSAFQFWSVRRKTFRSIANTKIAQAAAAASTQIGMGLANPSPLGLLLGASINSGLGLIGLARRFFRDDAEYIRLVNFGEMKKAFLKNINFLKYSTLESLSNSASIFLPIILISSFAASAEAGYTILAMQVMQAPMSLIGSATAQVYLSRAPEEYRSGTLGIFTSKILGGLLRTGVGPLIFAGIVAPIGFSILFGERWRPAGELVVWMTPWLVMQFLSSPISMALHVTGHLKTALILQILGFIIRVGSIYLAISFYRNEFLPEFYSLSGFLFYIVYIITVLSSTRTSPTLIAAEVRRSILFLIFWMASGLISSIMLTQANEYIKNALGT